jgi:hypothetical protein
MEHAVPANIPNRIDEVAVAGIHRGRFSGPEARAKQGDKGNQHGLEISAQHHSPSILQGHVRSSGQGALPGASKLGRT